MGCDTEVRPMTLVETTPPGVQVRAHEKSVSADRIGRLSKVQTHPGHLHVLRLLICMKSGGIKVPGGSVDTARDS